MKSKTSLEGQLVQTVSSSPRLISRRNLLRLLYAPLAVPLAAEASRRRHKRSKKKPERTGAPPISGPLSGSALYSEIIAYYNFGEHRTATTPDQKTSDWLAGLLRKAGFHPSFQSFNVDQFFLKKAQLVTGADPIASFPLWPPRATGQEPIKDRLALFPTRDSIRGRIAVVRFPFDPHSSIQPGSDKARLIEGAARAGARAVIAISEGPTGEIVALNSTPGPSTWPVPVLLAPSRNEPEIISAAQRGEQATFLLDGAYNEGATARNVAATLDRGGKKLIVISTPQSGWFRCAGERGPGVAYFIGLARWAASRDSDTSFLFVSTSGHELGEIGMKAFVEERAPAPRHVLAWIHLGAGMATYTWEPAPNGAPGMRRTNQVDSNRYLMCSSELVPMLEPIYSDLPGLQPRKAVALGEFEILIKKGYKTIGFAAGHQFHHTPADSPEVTSPEILEPVGQALIRTIESIEETTKD